MNARKNGAGEVTRTQRRWLRAIAGYIDQHGFGPSYADLQERMKPRGGSPLARNSAASMVKSLERKGLIERAAGKYRSVRVTVLGREALAR